MHFITLKTILFSVLIFTLGTQQNICFAQKDKDNTNEINTLFGDDISHGGYGALSFGYTQVAGRNAMTSGIKGAWIINHGIGLGFAGTGYFTEIESGVLPNEALSAYTGGHGGLLIEPILFGKNPIHVSIPLIIGGGAVVYGSDLIFNEDFVPEYPSYYQSFFDYYFLFEPGIEIEFNLTHFFRLAVGVSYRLTSDVHLSKEYDYTTYEILKADDLRNFDVHIVFKFGKF